MAGHIATKVLLTIYTGYKECYRICVYPRQNAARSYAVKKEIFYIVVNHRFGGKITNNSSHNFYSYNNNNNDIIGLYRFF